MRYAPFQMRILFVLASLTGLLLICQLKLKLYPSPITQSLSVSFNYRGASSELVEREVTSVLESAFSRLENIIELESYSRNGAGQVSVVFDRSVSMEDMRLQIATTVRQLQATFPDAVTYPRISYLSQYNSDPVLLVYNLISDLPPELLKSIIDRKITQELAGIEDIRNVSISGLLSNEIVIELEDNLLSIYDLDYDIIRQNIQSWNSSFDLGMTTDPESHQLIAIRVGVRGDPLNYIEQLKQLKFRLSNGRVVLLKDLGEIHLRPQKSNYQYRINGENSVNLVIHSAAQGNQIELARKVKQKMTIAEKALAGQVELILSTDRSNFLQKQLATILKRIAFALFILLICMVIIYRKSKIWMPVWAGFTVTLLVAVLLYHLVGLELHLYSLAGLTLSLGIVLDNLIIATDHLYNQKGERIFLALLAATLTTVGALSIVFFISPEYREHLTDFAWVFFINIGVSLLVALFFIPAIIRSRLVFPYSIKNLRRIVRWNGLLERYIVWISRYRWLPMVIMVLSFGVPLFLLPVRWEAQGNIPALYNKVMDGYYGKKIHPNLSLYFGGALRLFFQAGERFKMMPIEEKETILFVRAKLPFGGTLEQMDELIRDFERFLIQFEGIEKFHSTIGNSTDASIEIFFKPNYVEGAFPYQLQRMLETKAIRTGAGDLAIFGVGPGFNNELKDRRLSTHLRLLGYNYNQLWQIAEMVREELLENMRIQEVFINDRKNDYTPRNAYYEVVFNKKMFPMINALTVKKLGRSWFETDMETGAVGYVQGQHVSIPIRLESREPQKTQLWEVLNAPRFLDSVRYFKQHIFSNLQKRSGNLGVSRINQQYQLFIEYDFIGHKRQEELVKLLMLDDLSGKLPPGYYLQDSNPANWWNNNYQQLALVIGGALLMIFFVSAILFNSVRQAFIPLISIPPAFIGIFLTSYWLDFNFDLGGFTSFLLVAGLSVNAAIFIINDYNNIKKHNSVDGSTRAYIKAFNLKIIPIILTAVSTILGLLPFVLFDRDEAFWYALAICTIGGLIFSLFGICLLLPLFFSSKIQRHSKIKSSL
ncbi:efflux RND transporter permease subunit [Flavilitoribacter nigricans]|uniref:Uncharacterized protein n=1 Tax=Flavilitoribacter nigricans (strain ATCC 23147 / DSM 23189 / NBRC 102662 / NCIMB 1420 / SS-2) TaxID=1122177 RepID=A0A2D0MYS0_FLAN2|nr:efflux RND transporter permease subunit [Flavilitoribacter nigricans]PHN01278.1 hypothetical protein CRP01_38010 [Flavilitoribacter nigricans DSM 23189 = NBRC 102662]